MFALNKERKEWNALFRAEKSDLFSDLIPKLQELPNEVLIFALNTLEETIGHKAKVELEKLNIEASTNGLIYHLCFSVSSHQLISRLEFSLLEKNNLIELHDFKIKL